MKHLAATVVYETPPALGERPIVCWCLPGGGMSRRYFDLEVPAGLGNYSMAAHLARKGLVAVTLDPPGVGESDAPDDGYALTPEAVADVDAAAMASLADGLAAGTLAPGLPPIGARSIGLGHSAGALLTVYQQARHATHDGLALLGFAGGGLPSHLTDAERRFANDPAGARGAVAELAAARFGEPLPMGSTATSTLLVRGTPPEAAMQAIAASASAMLTLVGLTSMIPGASAEEMTAIDVPVLVAVGEHDITGDPQRIPAQLPHGEVTLFVLPGAGHNHNIAENREVLWDRVAEWARTVGDRPCR